MQRLLRQMISSHEKTGDLETQHPAVVQQCSDLKRLEFVRLLFKIKIEALTEFPGIASYCDFLEREVFPSLIEPKFGLIWGLISCTTPKELGGCWEWTLAVLRVIQSEQSEISIHDILRRLEQQENFKRDLGRDQDNSYLYIAIFDVLCWSSFMVRPRLIFPDDVALNLTCLLAHDFNPTNNPNAQRIKDKSMRPMLTTFRSLKQQHWGDRSDELKQDPLTETDSLYEASLNIYTLRYFGHVTIQWVDTISEHLRFNPANRRLSLFRFPTFGALLAIHGGNTCSAIRRYEAHCAKDPLPSSPEADLC